MLRICISRAGSSNSLSCVLIGLQFLLLVFDMIGLNMVFAYSKMGRVIAFNVEKKSFYLPHLVEVSVFRMLSVCFVLVMVMFIFCKNVSFGSKLVPRSLGCFVIGSVWLFNLSYRLVSYSTWSGVKIVMIVFLCLYKDY